MEEARRRLGDEAVGEIDPDRLLSLLAEEIDDRGRAEAFIRKTKSELVKLG